MPKKTPEAFNYLANDPEFVPDPEIEEFMEEEIAHAPKDPDLLAQRLVLRSARAVVMRWAAWAASSLAAAPLVAAPRLAASWKRPVSSRRASSVIA